jgi:hypothetical protein
VVVVLKSTGGDGKARMWQDSNHEAPQTDHKDSTQHLHGEAAKRKAAQVAARAARKVDAKKRRLSEPHLIHDGNLQRCSVCGYQMRVVTNVIVFNSVLANGSDEVPSQ